MKKIKIQNENVLPNSFYSKFKILILPIFALGSSIAIFVLVNMILMHYDVIYLSKSLDDLSNSLRKMLISHTASMFQDALNDVYYGVVAYSKLLTPVGSVALTSDFEEFESMVRPLTFAAFSLLPKIAALDIKRWDGIFVGYNRNRGAGYYTLANSSNLVENATVYVSYFDAISGISDGLYTAHTSYSTVNRPMHSKNNAQMNWHVTSTKSYPCISMSQVVHGNSGAWGVATIEISLKKISNLLKCLDLKNGTAFVTSENGYLLAVSDTSRTVAENVSCQLGSLGNRCLVLASESTNPVISEVARKFFHPPSSTFKSPQDFHLSNVQISNELYFLDVQHVQHHNFSFVVFIAIPRSTALGSMGVRYCCTMPMVFLSAAIIFVLGFLFSILFACKICSKLDSWFGLNLTRKRVEASNDHKTRFLANMSHELRTPMACIIGLMDILQSDESLSMDQKDIVSQIRRCSKALLGILNNILDLSKIVAGKLDLETAPFDVTNELESLIDMFSVQCATSGVAIGLDLADDIPSMVKGDSCRFRQIFANLLSNSVKFTPHGWICIRGRVVERRVSAILEGKKVGTNSMETVIHFEVEDSGIGIPPEKWKSVFESFVQADESSTREHGGSGLGLSIVRALVERMGGHVSIQPKSGSGTLIAFDLAFQSVLDPQVCKVLNSVENERFTFENDKGEEQDRRKTVNNMEGGKRKTCVTPSSGRAFSTSIPDIFRQVRVLICIKEGLEVRIARDWLKRKGIMAIGSSDWESAMQSIQTWITKFGHLSESFRNGFHNESRSSENTQERFLILMDLGLVSGFQDSIMDVDVLNERLSELKSLFRPNMVLAWLMSPTTPPNLRKFLRESTASWVANKPLYPNKMWRLLQCMVGLRTETSTELDTRLGKNFNITNSLCQDILVAQGTDVHLSSGSKSAFLPRTISSQAKRCESTPPSRANSERESSTGKANKDYWDEYLENCSGDGGSGSLKIESIDSLMRAIEKEMQDVDTSDDEEKDGNETEDELKCDEGEDEFRTQNIFTTCCSRVLPCVESGNSLDWVQSSKIVGPLKSSRSLSLTQFSHPVSYHSYQFELGNMENSSRKDTGEDLRQKVLTKSIEIKRNNLKRLVTNRHPPASSSLPSKSNLTASLISSKPPISPSVPTSSGFLSSVSASHSTSTQLLNGTVERCSEKINFQTTSSNVLPISNSTIQNEGIPFLKVKESINHDHDNTENLKDKVNKTATDHSSISEKDVVITASGTPISHSKPLLRSHSHPMMSDEKPLASISHIMVPFTLPRSLPNPDTFLGLWDPQKQVGGVSLEGMRILVVEDTSLLRKIIIATLEKLGARVSAASDGVEAVETMIESYGFGKAEYDYLAENPFEKMSLSNVELKGKGSEPNFSTFHAVLMDCQMPRLDGYSATEQIRELESIVGGHVPIIALTAHGMASDRIKCLDAGMDDYLSKPSNGQKIAEVINKLVRRKENRT